MNAPLFSAIGALAGLYIVIWLRGTDGFADNDSAIAEYKQKMMLMFAKYGRGAPIDIAKMNSDTLTDMFKDFLITFNEYQATVGGKPITRDDVQKNFPIEYLNEYNSTMTK
jgi:hypothetical protein